MPPGAPLRRTWWLCPDTEKDTRHWIRKLNRDAAERKESVMPGGVTGGSGGLMGPSGGQGGLHHSRKASALVSTSSAPHRDRKMTTVVNHRLG